MNEYDSDRMQDLLNLSHGFETVKYQGRSRCTYCKYVLYKRESPRKSFSSTSVDGRNLKKRIPILK